MPRPPRLHVPGVYHVTAHAVARERLFRDRTDYEAFVRLLGKLVGRRGWLCHAFCLMSTHYHLLIRTPDADLDRGMQWLNGCYAQGANRRHGGQGHVFNRRYWAQLVERESHLLETVRYIALNPVRAGVCDRPEDWPWSSYAAAVGIVAPPPFVDVDWVVAHFGRGRSARERLRAFVEEGMRAIEPSQSRDGV